MKNGGYLVLRCYLFNNAGKKRSLRSNLKLAGWNLDYLVRLLFA
jgi:hypothetical protein